MRKNVVTWGILALMCLFAVTAFAADVNGKWVYEMTTPNGDKRQGTLNLTAEGEKLTGTVSGMRGETPISEGKISGDDISFAVVRSRDGQEFKMLYKGKVVGNELKLTVQFGERSFDITAKRSAS
jgi:hypothetical protein